MFRKGFEEIDSWTVWDRFIASADDAGVPYDDAKRFYADALNGDETARELIESVCDVEFA